MTVDLSVAEQIGIGFGSISAPNMTTEQALAEANEIIEYKIDIDWTNPAVCKDGRTLENEELALPIGPRLGGGALTPLVAAKALGLSMQDKELLDCLSTLGFKLGAHVDTGNRDRNFDLGTGCGACDKCEGNCLLFADNKAELAVTVESLIGEDFDPESYQKLSLGVVSKDNNYVRNLVGNELTEVLLDDGKGVNGHREQMVVFNYDENTTIGRDAYFKATGKQIFVVDMWYIKKLADAMSTAVNNKVEAKDLYQAMISFQVATYIGLCDGSHRPVILRPSEA